MADKELTRIEALQKKRQEYDDQRIKAEKDFQKAQKANDTEQMNRHQAIINSRTTANKQLDKQIEKEEKIIKAKEKQKKTVETQKKVDEAYKKLNEQANKPYKEREKLIKDTVDSARGMNKQVMEQLDLEKQNQVIRKLTQQGRKKEAELLKSIGDSQLELLNVNTRQQLLDFDSAKALEDIEDKKFEIAQLEQDIVDGKVQNVDKSKALVKSLKNEMGITEKILKNTKQKSDEAKAQKAAADKLKESSMDLVDAAEKQVMFAKELVKQMLANPYLAVAAGFMAILKLLEAMVNKSKQFQEQIKGSVSQGDQLTKQLAGAELHAKALGYSTAEAAGAIVDEFGSLNDVSADTVKAMGSFEKGLGISMSTSAKLMKNMQSVSGLTQEQSIELIKSGAAMAKINGVAPGAIMEDIANNTEEFAKYGRDGGKNMIRAAIHAKKLGLELGTLAKTSDSLLDFESSIQAEMEASMLIGKQMNLNKAREKALSGDLAGMAEEIKKQVGGQAEFEKMNVIQREALAASVGMNAAELGKMMSGEVAVKGEMDKIDAEEVLSKDLNDTSLALRNLMTVENALKVAVGILTVAIGLNTLSQGGLGKMFKGFGGKMGKMFSGLGGKMATLGTTMTGAISGLGSKMSGLFSKTKGLGTTVATKAGGMATKVGSKAAQMAGKAKGSVLKGASKVTGAAGKVVSKGAAVAKAAKGSVAKTAAKVASKGAGKALLRKIPGIGLVAGLGFAASRLMKGDALGALGEVASGAASIIPGVGTAVSAAIDVGMIARDASKAAKDTAETAKDATKVQVKEREAIIQKEKSMSNLSKKQVEAKKAADDAIVAQKKAVEKEKAKMVQEQTKKPEVKVVEQPKVKVKQPETRSKEDLEAELTKRRTLQQKQKQELFGPGSEKMRMGEKARRKNELYKNNAEIAKLIKAIEEQTVAIKEGSEKQVKATQSMVND